MNRIRGWLSQVEGEALEMYAQGKRCLEIGSYMGKSANHIAKTARLLYCMDTFRLNYETDNLTDVFAQKMGTTFTTLELFWKNTRKFDNVIPIVGDSQVMHTSFKDDEFEFIFIDAQHDYEPVKNDINNYLPKLIVGGILCMHDYDPAWGVKKAVDECLGKPDYIYESLAVFIKK